MKKKETNKRKILNFTNENKRKYLEEHFYYEIDTIRHLYKQLYDICKQYPDERYSEEVFYRKNIFLDSFLIHARLLLNFFYPKRNESGQPIDGWRNAVFAEDFIENYIPRFPEEVIKGYLKNITNRIGKDVAHLTINRSFRSEDEKPWEVDNIWSVLRTEIENFEIHISKEYPELKKLFLK